MTRFDAYEAALTASSPFMFYLWARTLASLFRGRSCKNSNEGSAANLDYIMLSPAAKLASAFSLLAWIGFCVCIVLPPRYLALAQASCDQQSEVILRLPIFILLPLVFAVDEFYYKLGRGIAVALIMPLLLSVCAWAVMVACQRHHIWTEDTNYYLPSFSRIR
jgi:hypothetical protein